MRRLRGRPLSRPSAPRRSPTRRRSRSAATCRRPRTRSTRRRRSAGSRRSRTACPRTARTAAPSRSGPRRAPRARAPGAGPIWSGSWLFDDEPAVLAVEAVRLPLERRRAPCMLLSPCSSGDLHVELGAGHRRRRCALASKRCVVALVRDRVRDPGDEVGAVVEPARTADVHEPAGPQERRRRRRPSPRRRPRQRRPVRRSPARARCSSAVRMSPVSAGRTIGGGSTRSSVGSSPSGGCERRGRERGLRRLRRRVEPGGDRRRRPRQLVADAEVADVRLGADVDVEHRLREPDRAARGWK